MEGEYREKRRELGQARVELSVLETERTEEELRDSERYRRLKRRVEELESELGGSATHE